jgi:hypothetical protein
MDVAGIGRSRTAEITVTDSCAETILRSVQESLLTEIYKSGVNRDRCRSFLDMYLKRAKGVEPSTFTLATCRGRWIFNIKNSVLHYKTRSFCTTFPTLLPPEIVAVLVLIDRDLCLDGSSAAVPLIIQSEARLLYAVILQFKTRITLACGDPGVEVWLCGERRDVSIEEKNVGIAVGCT